MIRKPNMLNFQMLKPVLRISPDHLADVTGSTDCTEFPEQATILNEKTGHIELASDDSRKFRNREETRIKIRSVIADLYAGEENRMDLSDDSDEYLPSGAENQRYCGVSCCSEDIFIACHICPAFLCYDHMNSSCDEHNRTDNPHAIDQE